MPRVSTWLEAGQRDLLPSLQISMVYPSRPESPTTSGWLQMIVTEVSFLSSMNRSRGALVGSARRKHSVKFGWKHLRRKKRMQEMFTSSWLLESDNNQKVKPRQYIFSSSLSKALPLGGGGGGVGGLGSSGAAASADVKQAFANVIITGWAEQCRSTKFETKKMRIKAR